MHDKHGRLIEEGDIVVAHSWPHGKQKPQKVLACNENSQSCNVILDHGVPGVQVGSSNANECVLVCKHDGTIVPAPEGGKDA